MGERLQTGRDRQLGSFLDAHYAMVYTGDPTRKSILDAIRKRHIYGATDNIILEVRMGDHFMGDEFQLKRSQPIRVKARGTRPIARIEVLKDSKVIYSTEPKQRDVSSSLPTRATWRNGITTMCGCNRTIA